MPKVTINDNWKLTLNSIAGEIINIISAANDNKEREFASLFINFPKITNSSIISALIIDGGKPVIAA